MSAELAELRQLKQELLIRSEVGRRVLTLETEPVRDALAWLETGVSALAQVERRWLWLAPLVGCCLAQGWRRIPEALAGGSAWSKMVPIALAVWKMVRDH